MVVEFEEVSVDLLGDAVVGCAITTDVFAPFWGVYGVDIGLLWDMKVYRMNELRDERIETSVLSLQEDSPF